MYARLQAVTAVTDLVGTRVVPAPLEQDSAFPAVVYQRISAAREHAMGSDPGLAMPRVQIDSWAQTYKAAVELAAEVRGALSRFRGTVTGVEILDAFLENERDDYDQDRELHRVQQDYRIWHREN